MKAKHKANLLKLAAYLDTLPDDYDRFDMAFYMADVSEHGDIEREAYIWEKRKPECGTVACAVGHGPAAGIRVYNDANWSDYAHRAFGADISAEHSLAFDYMFSGAWERCDNTPKGAAARIRTYVSLGKPPEGWSYEDPRVMA